MVKASSQRKAQPGATPSRDEGEGISKHQPQSQGVRRNCPWTEAEHLLFLLGLEEHGRGAWRAIASDFVGTRTATQVASHAQKYFLREGLPPSKREKKRPSIHDLRCSRNASQEDRHQLRTSLQQLNCESMESNESRGTDTQNPGAKASTGALAGRPARPKAETGSSGDMSAAVAGRPAPSTAHWSADAAYSFGAEGSPGLPGTFAPPSLPDRPRAHSLPDWQFAGRSAPLTAAQDTFGGQALMPDASDPAVGILDPLYDEVLNCDLPTEPGAYPRNPCGRASDMSLEHSFDQTHLGRGNSLTDARQLFPLSEGQAVPPEEDMMLGPAPPRATGDRSALWRQPFYTAYGSATGMYDSLFRPEPLAAAAAPAPVQRASLPRVPQQQVQHGFGPFDSPHDRHGFGSMDAARCSQPAPATHSLPQAPLPGASRSHALPDVSGGTPQLQHLGPLLSSQSAPPGATLPLGHYCSALYRPTQLVLHSSGPPAAESAFPSAGTSCMPSGDSVDDLRILAQRADEMGIATSDLEPQNMDEILGSMSLGMDMDL